MKRRENDKNRSIPAHPKGRDRSDRRSEAPKREKTALRRHIEEELEQE